ncbi:MAG: DUF3306 domain-containing protein [Roseinatronobacter sp.]
MAKTPEEDSFLSRWSRRKAEARLEEAAPVPAPAPAPEPEPAPKPAPDTITPEELAALPKIEELVAGTDIRGFLRPGVPVALKNAALRKMWMLTPAIRDYRDPAVDYAWDWNTPGGVPGDGVGPSAERAAQMLRDLITPQSEPVAEPCVGDAQSLAEGAACAATEGEPVAQAQPKDTNIPKPEHDKNPSNQSDTDAPIPRRRHGGALPS